MIVLQHSADARSGYDGAGLLRALTRSFDQPVSNTLVVPLGVIVLHILVDHEPEMPPAEEDHSIQAFGLDRSDKTLSICVQVRTLRRELHATHPRGGQRLRKLCRARRVWWSSDCWAVDFALLHGSVRIESRSVVPRMRRKKGFAHEPESQDFEEPHVSVRG